MEIQRVRLPVRLVSAPRLSVVTGPYNELGVFVTSGMSKLLHLLGGPFHTVSDDDSGHPCVDSCSTGKWIVVSRRGMLDISEPEEGGTSNARIDVNGEWRVQATGDQDIVAAWKGNELNLWRCDDRRLVRSHVFCSDIRSICWANAGTGMVALTNGGYTTLAAGGESILMTDTDHDLMCLASARAVTAVSLCSRRPASLRLWSCQAQYKYRDFDLSFLNLRHVACIAPVTTNTIAISVVDAPPRVLVLNMAIMEVVKTIPARQAFSEIHVRERTNKQGATFFVMFAIEADHLFVCRFLLDLY